MRWKSTARWTTSFTSPRRPVRSIICNFPIQTLKVGSLGTHNTLGLAKLKNARFLLASTSEVYGDPERHPQREDYWGNVNPIGLRGCYDEAKRFSEAITMAYHRAHGVDTRIVRIFNTYGPRMRLDDGRVLPNFMGQALRGEPLTVYGDGSQTRSFCYVDDLVEGVERLLFADFHEPVNIGNPDEVTILQFAQEILDFDGRQGRASNIGRCRRTIPRCDKPDIGRAASCSAGSRRIEASRGFTADFGLFSEENRRVRRVEP